MKRATKKRTSPRKPATSRKPPPLASSRADGYVPRMDGTDCGVIGGARRDACVYKQGHDGPHFNGYDVFADRPRNTSASKSSSPIASSAKPVVRGPQVELLPSSPAAWTPPPARSKNQCDGDVGNKIVVSVRLRRSLVDKLDAEVEANVGAFPPITRNELVKVAIEGLLAELARERSKGRAA